LGKAYNRQQQKYLSHRIKLIFPIDVKCKRSVVAKK